MQTVADIFLILGSLLDFLPSWPSLWEHWPLSHPSGWEETWYDMYQALFETND